MNTDITLSTFFPPILFRSSAFYEHNCRLKKKKKKLRICQNLTWTVKIIKSSNFWLINTAFIYWRQESVQGLGKLISFACSRPIDIPIPFNFILVAKMVYALVNIDGSRWYQVCFIFFFISKSGSILRFKKTSTTRLYKTAVNAFTNYNV